MDKIEIIVDTSANSIARVLYSSLQPDNRDFPKDLKMKMRLENQQLILELASPDGVDTLISTVDEILEHIQVSLETLKEAV